MPEKKDPYSSPAMKVLRLYILLLFSGRKFSLAELARKFDCSKQTILRMMEQINLSKFEQVESWEDEGRRYFRARTPQQRPNLVLDVEAIQHLLLCRDIVWHLLPQALRQEIEQTIAQTTVLLPDFNQRAEALTSFARNQAKGSIDYSDHQEILSTLLDAIQKKHICQVAYRSSSSKKPKEFRIAPLKLVAYRDGLYIRGRLEEALANPEGFYDPTLAVHRIVSLKETERSFRLPAGRHKRNGQTFGFMTGEPFQVQVGFQPAAAAYVSERIWSEDQVLTHQADGGVILEFTATSRQEVISWVLSFGREADLLGPEDLRSELATLIGKLSGRYRVKPAIFLPRGRR